MYAAVTLAIVEAGGYYATQLLFGLHGLQNRTAVADDLRGSVRLKRGNLDPDQAD